MDLHIQAAGMGALVEALVVIGTPTAHKTQVDPVVQTVAMASSEVRRPTWDKSISMPTRFIS